MSKTDKTKPLKFKEQDPHLFYDEGYGPWPKWWVGEARCGCRMCTDQRGRKEARRRERYAGKRECRQPDWD